MSNEKVSLTHTPDTPSNLLRTEGSGASSLLATALLYCYQNSVYGDPICMKRKVVFKLAKFLNVYHTIEKVAPLVHCDKLIQLSAFTTLLGQALAGDVP